MPTLTKLQSALADKPNLSNLARFYAQKTETYLSLNKSEHLECDKTTLGELARAMQVETTDNGVTYSLTIENGAHRVILQTPVNNNFKPFEK